MDSLFSEINARMGNIETNLAEHVFQNGVTESQFRSDIDGLSERVSSHHMRVRIDMRKINEQQGTLQDALNDLEQEDNIRAHELQVLEGLVHENDQLHSCDLENLENKLSSNLDNNFPAAPVTTEPVIVQPPTVDTFGAAPPGGYTGSISNNNGSAGGTWEPDNAWHGSPLFQA